MKRLHIIALDYGVSFAHSRSQLELIAAERLSGCAVISASALWPQTASPLKQAFKQLTSVSSHNKRGLIGLSFTLDPYFTPVSRIAQQQFGNYFPKSWHLELRMKVSRKTRHVVHEEILAQWQAFEREWNSAPDFVHLPDNRIYRMVFREILAKRIDFPVKSIPFLIENKWYNKTKARRINITLPPILHMPKSINQTDMETYFSHAFVICPDNSYILIQSGQIDQRLLAYDAHAWHREHVFDYLKSLPFAKMISRKNIFLF